MTLEHFIITTYCFVDDFLKKEKLNNLKRRGKPPAVSDAEVITMEIVGEYLGCGSDKGIWRYFNTHWLHFFPKLPSRTTFTRQCANLHIVKQKLQKSISAQLETNKDLFICDGFPIPTCHIKRYKRSKTELRGLGSVGHCAAKAHNYFGFKGHLLITQQGSIIDYDIAAANVDERDILPEIVGKRSGLLIGDKGLIRPELKAMFRKQKLNLQTPLRRNMNDTRSAKEVSLLMNIRRNIETVIGQLTERFQIQHIKAKDLWHFKTKVGRKILAHTVCFLFNTAANPQVPLQLEWLTMNGR